MVETPEAEAPDLGTHYGKVRFIHDYSLAAGGFTSDGEAGATAISHLLRELVMIGSTMKDGELRLYPID
jgi:hypothetical protein